MKHGRLCLIYFFTNQKYNANVNAVETPIATTFGKRPPLLCSQFSEIPKVSEVEPAAVVSCYSFIIPAATVVLWLESTVSVVCSIVFSKVFKPFM